MLLKCPVTKQSYKVGVNIVLSNWYVDLDIQGVSFESRTKIGK